MEKNWVKGIIMLKGKNNPEFCQLNNVLDFVSNFERTKKQIVLFEKLVNELKFKFENSRATLEKSSEFKD